MKRASQTQDCHCQERAKFTEVGRCLLLSHLTSNSLTEVGIQEVGLKSFTLRLSSVHSTAWKDLSKLRELGRGAC
jgi:hypothetical protein